MRIALLGVRGSTPAPGPRFVRYGGHTSCVAVLPDGPGPPALLLDAGTGLRELPALLDGDPFRGHLVLSHLHWDHVQGLPFCPSVDRPDAAVAVHLPAPAGVDPAGLLARGMSPPHFPIGPDGLLGDWSFHASADFTPADFARTAPAAGDLRVRVAAIGHRGLTHGIRVQDGSGSLAYLPDHSPRTACPAERTAAEDLARGVDLLVHDAQFTEAERTTADAYGHATVDDAVDFARRCGAGRLLLTHHAPGRTDDQLDALADDLAARFPAPPAAVAAPDDRSGCASGYRSGDVAAGGRTGWVLLARQGEVLRVRPAGGPGPFPPGSEAGSGAGSGGGCAGRGAADSSAAAGVT